MAQCGIILDNGWRCDNEASHSTIAKKAIELCHLNRPAVCSSHKKELQIPDDLCLRLIRGE